MGSEKEGRDVTPGEKTSSWEKSDLYGAHLWDMAKSAEGSHF